MDQVQETLSATPRLRWERSPLQLGGDTVSAQLVHLLDVGQPIHHLLPAQLAQRVEVQVPEPLMPQPRAVVATRGQTEWSGDGDAQQVETVRRPLHPCKKTLLLVPDVEKAVADADVAAILVELTEANNVGVEPRDEVHSRKRSVLAGLGLKNDGTGSLDGDLGSIAETNGSADLSVEIGEGAAAS